MSFWYLQFFQRRYENNSTWGNIVVKLNFFSFVFWITDLHSMNLVFLSFYLRQHYIISYSASTLCWWHILYFLPQIAFITTYHSSNRLGKKKSILFSWFKKFWSKNICLCDMTTYFELLFGEYCKRAIIARS